MRTLRSFVAELKRRNVIRVAAAYAVISWLIIQIAETVFPLFGYDDTPARVTVIVLVIGFVPALIMAWVFQMTPQGLQVDTDSAGDERYEARLGRRVDRAIIVVLVTAVAYFAVDKFLLTDEPSSTIADAPLDAEQRRAVLEPSIAVLPFADMSEQQDQEYFSDGIAESLLHSLAGVDALKVAARTSSFAFKGKDDTAEEIGAALNVNYVLEGSVRRSGDAVRVTAQLIETAEGSHIWSQTLDRPFEDIFALQDEIAEKVADALQVTLVGREPPTMTNDPQAYALYLQAVHMHRQFNEDSLLQAIELYRQVLEIDPDFADIWTNISSVYSNLAGMDALSNDEGYGKARDAAENALLLDPTNAVAFDQLGWIALNHDDDLEKAARFYERAIDLNPTAPGTIGNSGVVALSIGHVDLAVDIMEHHVQLDPVSAIAHNNLANAYWLAGRYADSERSIRLALNLSPELWGGHYRLGRALLHQGQFDDALASFAEEETDDEYRLKGVALAHYSLGNEAESSEAIGTLVEEYGEQYPDDIASVFAYRGDIDAAFEWLARTEDLSMGRYALRLDPLFDNLRGDARWFDVLERHNATDEEFATYSLNVTPP